MRAIITNDVPKFSEGSEPSVSYKKGKILDLPKGHPLFRRGLAKPAPEKKKKSTK